MILSDSQAAIAAVVKAGRKGHGRTKELRQAVNLIAKRCRSGETMVCLGWVKSHIGIGGNEAADQEAKKVVEGQRGRMIYQGGRMIYQGGQEARGQRA